MIWGVVGLILIAWGLAEIIFSKAFMEQFGYRNLKPSEREQFFNSKSWQVRALSNRVIGIIDVLIGVALIAWNIGRI